ARSGPGRTRCSACTQRVPVTSRVARASRSAVIFSANDRYFASLVTVYRSRKNCATPADPQHWLTLFQNPGVRCSGMPLLRIPLADFVTHVIHVLSPVTTDNWEKSRAAATGPVYHHR